MGENFAIYIEQLELLTFFSGYPLVYSIVLFIVSKSSGKSLSFSYRLRRLLPMAYALTGTLFLGLVLKEYFSDSQGKLFAHSIPVLLLKIWGILSILFWIPAMGKKPVYALIHSLVFFFFILKDLLEGMNSDSGKDFIRNDMKIYSISFIINIITLVTLILVSYIGRRMLHNKVNKSRL